MRAWFAGFVIIACIAAACGSANAQMPRYVTDALSHPARPPEHRSQDSERSPETVLEFAAIMPGQRVADLVPADGYYSRILSKVVGPTGRIYAFVPLRGFRNIQSRRAESRRRIEAGEPPLRNPLDAVLPLQHTRTYDNLTVIYSSLTAFGGNFGVPEQLDAVFTSGGYSQLLSLADGEVDAGPLNMAAVNSAIYRALERGGRYIVVDRNGPGFDVGRIARDVEAAGFSLEAMDSGEGDAFMLRFRKSPTASQADRRPDPQVMERYFGNTFVLGTPTQRFRTIFYNADGTLQEFGLNDMQLAHWYFDADGHNCMYHEVPSDQEGFVTCHPFTQDNVDARIGDVWVEQTGTGAAMPVALVEGHQYPNSSSIPRD